MSLADSGWVRPLSPQLTRPRIGDYTRPTFQRTVPAMPSLDGKLLNALRGALGKIGFVVEPPLEALESKPSHLEELNRLRRKELSPP